MTGHFLAPEPLIEARLKAVLPTGVHVLTAADLAGVEERQQVTPAVHVIYRGYRPTQDQGQGRIQEIEQTWWTVVAVRSVRDIKSGAGSREEAGPIVDATLEALMGWRPLDGFLPLKLAPATAPAYRAGFAYHPLGWTTRTTKRGADQ